MDLLASDVARVLLKELFMQKLLSAALLLVTACTDAPSSSQGRILDAQPVSPTKCAAACRIELSACGSTDDDLQLVKNCAADCPFTSEEANCLAGLACGADPSVCE